MSVEKYPRYLFVYELLTLELHSLLSVGKNDDFKSFDFDNNDNLFFAWGNSTFGVWNTEVIGTVNPFYSRPFKVNQLCFTPNREAILLRSLKSYCMYYPDQSFAKRRRPAQPKQLQKANPFTGHPAKADQSVNLKKVDLSLNETLRKSQEIKAEDLIDSYDKRNNIRTEYDSVETFGNRREKQGRRSYEFED